MKEPAMSRAHTFTDAVSRRRFLHTSAGLTAGLIGLVSSGRISAADRAAVEKQLKTLSENPFNGEPNLQALVGSHITPLEHFFVRSHGPVPEVDAASLRVRVEGLVEKPLELSVAELSERYPQHQAEATLTCAGNRRTEMNVIRKISGVAWDAGAIGNATWSGALLSDILKTAGVKPEAKHIWFEGADPIPEKDGSAAPFGGSIPIERAMLKQDGIPGALLATRMNGLPLLPAHGFPVRSLVPGFIGARSVKWLNRIVVSDRPSPNHFVKDVYKIVQEDTLEERAAQSPIYEFVVNGAIGIPKSGASFKAGMVDVAGYALPTGRPGCVVEQVSLSTDNGRTWQNATLQGPSQPYCWRLWSAKVPVTASTTSLTVRVRDSLGHVQPEQKPWNFKGYLFNSWHQTAVTVE